MDPTRVFALSDEIYQLRNAIWMNFIWKVSLISTLLTVGVRMFASAFNWISNLSSKVKVKDTQKWFTQLRKNGSAKVTVFLLLKSGIRFSVSASKNITKTLEPHSHWYRDFGKNTLASPPRLPKIHVRDCIVLMISHAFLELIVISIQTSLSIGIVCAYFLAQHAAFSCMNSIEHKMVWKVIFKSSCYALKFNSID